MRNGEHECAVTFLPLLCPRGSPSDIKRRSWLGLKPRGHAASVDCASMKSGSLSGSYAADSGGAGVKNSAADKV